MEEKFDLSCSQLENELKRNLPEISHFFSHERYDEDITDIGENDGEIQEEGSVMYLEADDKENSSAKGNNDDGFYKEMISSGDRSGRVRNLRFESLDMEEGDQIMRDYVNFKRKKRFGM